MNLRDADRITLAQKMFAAKSAVDFNFTGVKAFAIAREKLMLGSSAHCDILWLIGRLRVTPTKTTAA